MIMKIDDWEFDIDLERTMRHSAVEAADHCDCAYCRNFYATVDECYPQLRTFLAQFGLEAEAPEEMFPTFIYEDSLAYMPVYIVYGKILKPGQYELDAGLCNIVPKTVDGNRDYFALNCYEITLPWILQEPLKDVISPANEPSFLKKMWDHLLGLLKPNGPIS